MANLELHVMSWRWHPFISSMIICLEKVYGDVHIALTPFFRRVQTYAQNVTPKCFLQ